jgi:hypothetical protein
MSRGTMIVIAVVIVVVAAGVAFAIFYKGSGGGGGTVNGTWHTGDYIEYAWEMTPVNTTTGGDPYSIIRYTLVDVGSEWIRLNVTDMDAARDILDWQEHNIPANSTTFLSRVSVYSTYPGFTSLGKESITTPFGTVLADHYSYTYEDSGYQKYSDYWEVNGIFLRMVTYGDSYDVTYNIIFEATSGNLTL